MQKWIRQRERAAITTVFGVALLGALAAGGTLISLAEKFLGSDQEVGAQSEAVRGPAQASPSWAAGGGGLPESSPPRGSLVDLSSGPRWAARTE